MKRKRREQEGLSDDEESDSTPSLSDDSSSLYEAYMEDNRNAKQAKFTPPHQVKTISQQDEERALEIQERYDKLDENVKTYFKSDYFKML